MDFASVIPVVAETGVLIFIAVVFVMDKVGNGKTVNAVLQKLEISASIQTELLKNMNDLLQNQNKMLNLIETTTGTTAALLERHDKRSEYMNNDVVAMYELIKAKPCIHTSDTHLPDHRHHD